MKEKGEENVPTSNGTIHTKIMQLYAATWLDQRKDLYDANYWISARPGMYLWHTGTSFCLDR